VSTTNPLSILTSEAAALAGSLPDPVPVPRAAKVLSVSAATAYSMCHRFIAARRQGDLAGMRENIPCIRAGEQRYIIPRAAFIAFYVGAGLSRDLLRELYGSEVADELEGPDEQRAAS
jgi:hypothetical protein